LTNDCSRCGTPTESPYVTTTGHLGFDGWLCDECRESFEEWLAAKEEKPPVRGACSSCAGTVEVRFRYMGAGVEVVANCPTCGWTEEVNE